MSPKGPRRPSLQPPLFRSSDSWALDDDRDVLPAPRQPGRLRPRRPLPPLGKGSLSENGKDTCCGRFKQKPSFLVSLEKQLTRPLPPGRPPPSAGAAAAGGASVPGFRPSASGSGPPGIRGPRGPGARWLGTQRHLATKQALRAPGDARSAHVQHPSCALRPGTSASDLRMQPRLCDF